ncbi:patatin-like phospholipase family protein [Gynuella sp.]|uniref:patatin-like phospholipase family protein n=1 Tax=Gynuella sp. TaxID=2969146 RepID=UPI003D0ADCDE
MKRALILSGGGAKAAYQVGVLKAVKEVIGKFTPCPFEIVCGTSAGAINALGIAGMAGNFNRAVSSMDYLWRTLEIDQVVKSGWIDTGYSLARISASLLNQGRGQKRPISLLDNAPLREFLIKHVRFEDIDKAITRNKLEAVSITAMGYQSGESVSFYQGKPDIKSWRGWNRVGVPTKLDIDHLMASSAIPTLFPPVRINREYFGDGALRQTAPLSPAIHLGAEKLFIIGTSDIRKPTRPPATSATPSIAQVVGHILNGAFVDNLQVDVASLQQTNDLLRLLPKRHWDRLPESLRIIDYLQISPSQSIDNIASKMLHFLPDSIKFFLRVTGGTRQGGGISAAAYLLFNSEFCGELIELGYRDGCAQADDIKTFFDQ